MTVAAAQSGVSVSWRMRAATSAIWAAVCWAPAESPSLIWSLRVESCSTAVEASDFTVRALR